MTMGKKMPSRARPSKSAGLKKTTKHVDALLALSRAQQMAFFETATESQLLQIFEESYPSDVVNVLLDLKKSAVKHLLETVAAVRKRAVAEAATLFYYKEYLTNPVPLKVDTEAGIAMPNYYAILGVPRDATEEDLKSAHRLLANAHDPAVFSPAMRKSGEERLMEIEEAYNNLKTPQRRARTDKLLPNVNYYYPRRDLSWLESVHRLIE